MNTTATTIYATAALLCLLASLLGTEGFRPMLLTYVAAPVGAASLAQGLASWRTGTSRLDVVIAVVWAFAAVSVCVPLSAEPSDLERLFLAMKVQAALVGVGALMLLVNAARATRSRGAVVFRALHCGGLLVLALLLGRRSLATYASFSTSESQGLAALAAEITLFWRVVVACALAVAVGAMGVRAANGRLQRGTSVLA